MFTATVVFTLSALIQGAVPAAQATAVPAPAPDRAKVVAAAREVMEKARYCTLVTLGDDGYPQARVVDPFPPEDELTVWIATNPRTRKVADVRRNPRVTLLYFDAAAQAYATLVGRAQVVTDAAEKAKRWKKDWAHFYKDENRGDDYVLIRVRPVRLEIVSGAHGLTNDPRTWRPVTVQWRPEP